MKIDLEAIIKYPFTDREWVKKSGVLMAIFAVFSLLSLVIRFAGEITNLMFNINSEPGYGGGFGDTTATLGYLVLIAIFGFLLTIPFILATIYLSGYALDSIRTVMKGDEITLPEHREFGRRMWQGFKWGFIAIPYVIIISIAWIATFGLIFFGAVVSFTDGGSVVIGVIMMIIGGLLALISIALSLIIGFIAMQAATFLYVKYDSVLAGWDISKVVAISKIHWKNFAIISLILYALTIAYSFLSLILYFCCMGWIAQGVGTVWSQLVYARMLGQAFREIEA